MRPRVAKTESGMNRWNAYRILIRREKKLSEE